jgi:hypothetical protein
VVNRESECGRLYEQDSLSQNLQIKIWKEYLFCNLNEDSLWTVALIRKEGREGFRLSLIDGEDETMINRIGGIADLTTHLDEDDQPMIFVIDPAPEQLEELISAGAFSIHYHFQRIP